MKKEWIKESARDLIALGSITFLLLVIARALTGDYFNLVYLIIISLVIYFILSLIIKDSEYHLAIGFVLLIFLINFYNHLAYNIFSSIVYILMIISTIILEKSNKQIIKGVILGIISTIIGFYMGNLLGLSF